MIPRPPIFISAVSKELGSARQLVANTLQFLGYEPVWQDIFGTEQGDLREVLRRQIDQCKGVIQLVGQRYGAEPPKADKEFGRVSYTQYEALYARQRGKKVWYLILDPNFRSDESEEEQGEFHELQVAYRRRVQSDIHLYHPLTNSEALEAGVLKLRDELTGLRRGVKQWAFAVLALLALLVGAMVWLMGGQRSQRQTSLHVTELQQQTNQQLEQAGRDLHKIKEELAKWQQIINKFPATEAGVRQEEPGQKAAEVEERAYAELGKELGIDPKALREKLPAIAQQLKNAPNTTVLDRANAAFVAKDFARAEQLAREAANEAKRAEPVRLADAIKALELAGWSAENRIQYANAMNDFREAEKLSNRVTDSKEWARVQYAIGWVLYDQGKYHDAEAILAETVNERTTVVGAEHPDTLSARFALVRAIWAQGKYGDAEEKSREIIRLRDKVLGPEHSDTLKARNILANALWGEGKYDEAETIYRDVLSVRERALGPEHRDTLMSRSNLANIWKSKGKDMQAEIEFRKVLQLQDKVLGPDHPDTLVTRRNLVPALGAQGKYAECEQECRAIIDAEERALGVEHPDTLRSRSDLAVAWISEGKYSQAVTELGTVLKLQETILGSEHPDTLRSRSCLASAWMSEGKYTRAETEFRTVLRLRETVLGSEHPSTIESRRNLAWAWMSEGKYVQAETEFRAVLKLQETVLGSEHPASIRSLALLAFCLTKEGKKEEAKKFAQLAAERARKILGPDHPDTKYAEKVRAYLRTPAK